MTRAAKLPRRPGTAPRGGRASVSAETTGSDARHAEPTTATQLRARREAAGLTLAELGRRVAALTSTDAEAWRVALSDYESGRKTPSAERVASVIEAIGATPADALRWELWSRLRPEAVGEMIERYGLDAVATELERRAASLRALVRDRAPRA